MVIYLRVLCTKKKNYYHYCTKVIAQFCVGARLDYVSTAYYNIMLSDYGVIVPIKMEV